MEGGGRTADTGRTMKGYGGGRRAEGEKFLLRFSKARFVMLMFHAYFSCVNKWRKNNLNDKIKINFEHLSPVLKHVLI